jgi:hypothetical protein
VKLTIVSGTPLTWRARGAQLPQARKRRGSGGKAAEREPPPPQSAQERAAEARRREAARALGKAVWRALYAAGQGARLGLG